MEKECKTCRYTNKCHACSVNGLDKWKPQKKSKWHKWAEEKPTKIGGEIEVWATGKKSGELVHSLWRGHSIDFLDTIYTNIYWRYVSKPPKEYRK